MTTTNHPRQNAPRLKTSAMIASFADPGQKTTPAPFGHALNRLAEERPEIVGLSADLAKYTDMHIFRDANPDRFFQMGMSEQSLLGAAAGLAEVGLVPFASTYSVFATRRAYDFLCLDIAEPGLNVNVVGALPGPHHRLRAQPPGHRGPGDPSRLPEPDHRRPVRRGRHRAGRTRARRARRARRTSGCCAAQVPRVLDEYDYRFELGKAAELRTGATSCSSPPA